MIRKNSDERGTVLLGVLLTVLILTLLGLVSMNLATQEVLQISTNKNEAAARHLAEAGADLVVRWFHDPTSTPVDVQPFVVKRYDLPDIGSSFFDAAGRSQFSGSSDMPNVLYDATRPSDDRLLNDPSAGWFRSLSSLGRIERVKVYGPTRPGLLCSVDVTATAKHLSRTISLQLGALAIPTLRAGVQIAHGGISLTSSEPFPVWLHWGALKVQGDVPLGRREDIPIHSSLAPVNGQSYADMTVREDRWLNLWIGQDALFAPTASGTASLPSNVYPHRDPSPGLHMDVWPYELLKKYALKYGVYYSRDSEGLLYRNGTVRSGLGMTVEEVFRSRAVGEHHGLVFIDTLDALPPHGDNLGTILIETDYAEGIFIVNAHIQFRPRGSGKSVSALSPPDEGSTSVATRIPVTLSGIHLNGILSTAGDVSYEGRPRVFGALLVEGHISPSLPSYTPIEVWYDSDFRNGMFRGLPVVFTAPGTWQEKY